MKLFPTRQFVSRVRPCPLQAMTLVETMIAMAVFSFGTVALIYAHMFALVQEELVQSKLGSSEEARRSLNLLSAEIRSAKLWRIGSGTETDFTPIPNGTNQQGNALQINQTTATNSFIYYYFNTNSSELRRVESGVSGHTLIADHLTNNMFFRAEDYLGNMKTDLSYKYVVRCIMEFYQYQYPLTKVGPGYFYDYYKLELKITPHCPDGA